MLVFLLGQTQFFQESNVVVFVILTVSDVKKLSQRHTHVFSQRCSKIFCCGCWKSWGKLPHCEEVSCHHKCKMGNARKPKHVQIFTGSGLEFQFVDGSRGDSCWTFMKKSLTTQSPFESLCSRPLDMEEQLCPQLMSSSQNCVNISWLMRESTVMAIWSKINKKKTTGNLVVFSSFKMGHPQNHVGL